MAHAQHTASDDQPLRVTRRIITSVQSVSDQWQALQQHAHCSYFQSWGWIGSWLSEVVADREPCLVEVADATRVVALGILTRAAIRRRGFVRASLAFLNEYPLAGRNMVIEYNGLLIDAQYHDPAAIYRALIDELLMHGDEQDELRFGGMTDLAVVEKAVNTSAGNYTLNVEEVSTSWRVNLAGLEAGLEGALKRLSRNRRGQIRRSLRLYEARGELCLSVAQDTDQALSYFDALGRLHGERWRRRGAAGSFANATWAAFHRHLIETRFAAGEVQLIRVMAGGEEVGYLYNFIWRDRVYVLQTGFAISDDKHLMPGYVVHLMAIVHNARLGMAVYDFMHGDSVYKRVLADCSEPMYWLSIQKRCLKFTLERLLLSAYRATKAVLSSRRANAS